MVAVLPMIAACASGSATDAKFVTPSAGEAPPFVLVEAEAEPVATQEELATGGFLFANMCGTCHGGAGQTGRRIAINRSDYAGIKEIIARGTIVYGGNMPAWTGILSPDQIDDVAKFILASQRN
jgi:mono/diheme cytochrome c family protein